MSARNTAEPADTAARSMKRVADIIRELETRDLLELARGVARNHYVTLEELVGRTRRSPEAKARHELWYLLYEQIPSFPKLGEIFGRDHSTILSAVHNYARDHGTAMVVGRRTDVDVSCAPAQVSECREVRGPMLKKCGPPQPASDDVHRREVAP
jgi:hypothetical protein